MKILVSILLFATCHCCLAQIDTNLLATGDWSEPVTDGDGNSVHTLRGRLLVYDVCDKGETMNKMYAHARVYLELQQLKPNNFWPETVEIYYDPGFNFYTTSGPDVAWKDQRDASGVVTNGIQHHQPSLNLEVRDGNNKPYPNEAIMINGSFPAPCWVTLSCDATVRLRADIYTLADSKKPDGLEIFVNGGSCTIPPHATNDYYLCGTFSPPTNHPSPLHYDIWQGTLNLPRVKIPSR